MTSEQIRCLDLYEAELRPGLAPIDRSVELNTRSLAVRVYEVRTMLPFTDWPPEKIYAAAIRKEGGKPKKYGYEQFVRARKKLKWLDQKVQTRLEGYAKRVREENQMSSATPSDAG